MIKAVFFDLSYTLACGEPSREDAYDRAFRELGFNIPTKALMRGIAAADSFVFKENLVPLLLKGSDADKFRIGACYPKLILKEANLEAPDETILKLMKLVVRDYRKSEFRFYDDVLPALKLLKKRGLKLGMVTNAAKEQMLSLQASGINDYIDFVANAEEAGADKPKPPIFELALKRAGVTAAEAAHVGDQFELDVLGAKGVGIKAIWIDRYDLYPESDFTPRIKSLGELPEYL